LAARVARRRVAATTLIRTSGFADVRWAAVKPTPVEIALLEIRPRIESALVPAAAAARCTNSSEWMSAFTVDGFVCAFERGTLPPMLYGVPR
jgi:hypothetical protein